MASTAVKRKAGDEGADSAKKPKADASITSFFGAPKKAVDASDGAAPALSKADKFNKEEWVKSLSEEQRELLKLEIDTLHDSWIPYLKDELTSPGFLGLKRFLKSEEDKGSKIFPPKEDIYSWSRHTPLDTVRVVVVGQDPYHNFNQAHGLCFSVRPPTPAPPSLVNIYKALKKDYPSFEAPPKNGGLLTPWADRGVLLLNTCLTVEAHKANSHQKKGWEAFTKKVLDVVAAQRRNGVVFMAWGNPAQQRCTGIASRHLVLKAVHPSPLSAAKGWFDCGHFKKANEWLETKYGKEGLIDWNLNVAPEKAGV